MERIKGLIDAPFTPFYENGEVNLEPIEAYAKMLVKNGLQGVFINGSSGEGYMLTEEERMRLAERWVSVAPEGFKVIVHVGSCCVKASRMLAEHAQKIGAWGIGAMAPPFPKIGRIEELVKYIEEIAAGAPELPFYYYHIPAFNGAFLPMVKLLEAVDGRVPNFAGIKYTFESMYEYNQCRLYKNGKFDMLHGQDETILPCLGMQLMCSRSEEGEVDCLGIFDVPVKRFVPQKHEDKVPHMGWNTIGHLKSDLFEGFTQDEFVYFVHSFYVPVCEFTAAETDYIHPFSAALHKDNFYATQFHPEKSGAAGERILRNFLDKK